MINRLFSSTTNTPADAIIEKYIEEDEEVQEKKDISDEEAQKIFDDQS